MPPTPPQPPVFLLHVPASKVHTVQRNGRTVYEIDLTDFLSFSPSEQTTQLQLQLNTALDALEAAEKQAQYAHLTDEERMAKAKAKEFSPTTPRSFRNPGLQLKLDLSTDSTSYTPEADSTSYTPTPDPLPATDPLTTDTTAGPADIAAYDHTKSAAIQPHERDARPGHTWQAEETIAWQQSQLNSPS